MTGACAPNAVSPRDRTHERLIEVLAPRRRTGKASGWLRSGKGGSRFLLLAEIAGDPFGKVCFDPNWRTWTVLILARLMYDSREFSLMPILADALQDAGCDNDDMLTHCRDTKQAHVRGCWVVDLVLGKT